jgi:hypothetical protein
MTTRMARKRGIRPNWSGPLAGSWVIAGAVVLVLLFVGSTAATPVVLKGSPVTYKPPYSGQEIGTATLSQTGCGGSTAILVNPFFNLTTGKAFGADNLSQRSCGSVADTASLDLEAGFVANSSFTGIGGNYKVKTTWVLTFSVVLVASPGSIYQAAVALFEVEPIVEIFDETNGSALGPSSYSHVLLSISSGSYLHTYSALHMTQYSNQTLKKSHTYVIEAYAMVYTYVYVTPGTSYCSAYVNMGGKGKVATLTSLTVG